MKRSHSAVCVILGFMLFSLPLFAHDKIKTVIGGGPNGTPGLASSIPAIGQIAADVDGNVYMLSGLGAVYKWSNGKVTHIAGDETYAANSDSQPVDSFDGDAGPALHIQLSALNAIGVDGASPANVYVSDSTYCIIQEIEQKTGQIIPVAGSLGTASTDSGPSCNTFLNGLAVNGKNGGLYVAPNESPVWFPTGLTGETATEDCSAYPAYGEPGFCLESLAVDTSVTPANVYVGINCRVDEIVGATGQVYTVAGSTTTCGSTDNVTATLGQFNQIEQIAVTGNGTTATVLVADGYNSSIRQFTVASVGGKPQPGKLTTIAGVSGGAACVPGTKALGACISPTGIAIDGKGKIYIADANVGGVYQLLPTGSLALIVGGELGPEVLQNTLAQPALSSPAAVFADPASANVYVGGGGSNAVLRWNSVTTRLSDFAGNGNPGFAGDGKSTLAAATELNSPAGMAKDTEGNVYVVDQGNCRIREVNAVNGTITTFAGETPCGYAGDGGSALHAQFDHPNAIAFDALGNMYVADTNNCAIRRIDHKTRIVTTIAGGLPAQQCLSSATFSGDGGPAIDAQLAQPASVSFDAGGNLFIADTGNAAVREIVAATGVIQTVAGIGGNPGFNGDPGQDGSGLATEAQLNTPSWVRADSNGNLFIADAGNNVVRWVTPARQIITFGGTPPALVDDTFLHRGFEGDDGSALNADFYSPVAIDQDALGNYYIVDQVNNRIRQISAFPGFGLSEGQLTFADQAIDTASAAQTIVVSAIGPVKFGVVAVGGGFSEKDTCTHTQLVAGQTCEVQVTFNPKTAGPSAATLRIYSNALLAPDGYGAYNGNPDTVTLSGVAIQ